MEKPPRWAANRQVWFDAVRGAHPDSPISVYRVRSANGCDASGQVGSTKRLRLIDGQAGPLAALTAQFRLRNLRGLHLERRMLEPFVQVPQVQTPKRFFVMDRDGVSTE